MPFQNDARHSDTNPGVLKRLRRSLQYQAKLVPVLGTKSTRYRIGTVDLVVLKASRGVNHF